MKANKKTLISTVILLVIISSCTVMSFYPLYTEDVLIRNDKIIGTWEATNSYSSNSNDKDTLIWEIALWKEELSEDEKVEPRSLDEEIIYKYAYSLNISSSAMIKREMQFILFLIEINGETYLDLAPVDWEPNNLILESSLMRVHIFAKINIEKDNIVTNWLNSEWFEKKLEDNMIHIKHEREKDRILLTTQPSELQKFVSKYSTEEGAFDSGLQYTLKPLK